MSRIKKNYKKIRYCIWYLIFSFISSCGSKQETSNAALNIRWEQNKPIGLVIPSKLLASVPVDSIENLLHVTLEDQNSNKILGKYVWEKDSLVFRPLIALTRGLTYNVYLREQFIGKLTVPTAGNTDTPSIVAIYPQQDTVPENLLKIHIEFSKPMQEGSALTHLVLLKNNRDTLRDSFLDLQPELWSNDGKTLTIWFDPGRIKRDLQPNLKLGPPLQESTQYELIVTNDWVDREGAMLQSAVHKNFITVRRDQQSPDINKWTITPVKAGTRDKLSVDFHESLDYVLIKNAIYLLDAAGKPFDGEIEVTKDERGFSFIPSVPWASENYILACESRMEDLAGNNLNRLFDSDLAGNEVKAEKEVFKRIIEVKR